MTPDDSDEWHDACEDPEPLKTAATEIPSGVERPTSIETLVSQTLKSYHMTKLEGDPTNIKLMSKQLVVMSYGRLVVYGGELVALRKRHQIVLPDEFNREYIYDIIQIKTPKSDILAAANDGVWSLCVDKKFQMVEAKWLGDKRSYGAPRRLIEGCF